MDAVKTTTAICLFESTSAECAIEVSVVIPCLNETKSLGFCIEKSLRAFASDGSIEIAEGLGARVIRVGERGYGAALRAGIHAARGRFIVMGDADDSYDFTEVPKFVRKLRAGSRRPGVPAPLP